MFIDSHAHLDFKEFNIDRDEVIKRAKMAGVLKIINVGANLERSKRSVELAKKYSNIYATVGVHPHDCEKDDLNVVIKEFKDLISEDKERDQTAEDKNKIVAIGEIGLDYYQLTTNDRQSAIKKQKETFEVLLNLAIELKLPIIFHCRDAYEDMIKIISKIKNQKLKIMGVIHCFSGDWQIAQRFLNLGLYLSFTGAITYPGKKAAKIEEVIKNTPLERILIETDCPYLAPIPYRGQRNKPAYVVKVAEKISQIKNLPLQTIAEQTTKNAVELFNLKILS
jgi:TatD DNase family protein